MTGREARRNNERLEYKFIVKYIENVHNDIYNKVTDLYEETKKANPKVKDLTKTEQFMSAAMPGTPVPRYYTTRNLCVNKSTHLVQGGPTMVLEIPLEKQRTMVLEIPLEKQQSAPVVPAPQCMPLPSTQTPPSALPLLLEKQQSAPVVPAPQCMPLPSTQTPPSTLPLLMPDDMYQQLLADLLKDPDLEQILNDFQTPSNDIDDDMNPFVQCDLFTIDDQSLLESEMDLH